MLKLTKKEYDQLTQSFDYKKIEKYAGKIDFLIKNLKKRKKSVEKQLKENNKNKSYYNNKIEEYQYILNGKKIHLYYSDYDFRSGYMSVNEYVIGLQILESKENQELYDIVTKLFKNYESSLIYHYEDTEEEKQRKEDRIPQNIKDYNENVLKSLEIASNHYKIIKY